MKRRADGDGWSVTVLDDGGAIRSQVTVTIAAEQSAGEFRAAALLLPAFAPLARVFAEAEVHSFFRSRTSEGIDRATVSFAPSVSTADVAPLFTAAGFARSAHCAWAATDGGSLVRWNHSEGGLAISLNPV